MLTAWIEDLEFLNIRESLGKKGGHALCYLYGLFGPDGNVLALWKEEEVDVFCVFEWDFIKGHQKPKMYKNTKW